MKLRITVWRKRWNMNTFKLMFLTLVIFMTTCTDIVPASPKGKEIGRNVPNNNIASNSIAQRIENIRKFPLDKRSYKGLKLKNDLKVLLVGDPSIEKSTVCLSIHMGYLNDFIAVRGLANFTGHMLLRAGVQKSEEHTFQKFVEAYGGSIYLPRTSKSGQTWCFEIKHPYLTESLEKFAEIFIQSRLLNDEAERPVLEKSLNAALQEYVQRKSDIENQILQVEKTLSKKNSMYNHIGFGIPGTLYENGAVVGFSINNATLYKHVQAFYKTWYSSNLMNLVVIQKEKIFEDLEEVIASSFGRIENKRREQILYEYPKHHPWGPEQLKQIVHIVLGVDVQSLRLTFPVPFKVEYYRTIPATYILHFISYNGKGSLSSFLRKRKLCTNLDLDLDSESGIGFLEIVCDITDNGVKRGFYFIVYLIFQYIHMLNDNYDEEEWIFSEITRIHELQFNNHDNNNLVPLGYAQTLSASLRIIPFEDVLTNEFVQKQWEPKHIREILDCLKPDNMNIILVSKQSPFKKETYETEKYFGTPYSVNKMIDGWIQIWNKRESARFKLEPPQRNEFLPEKFEVYPLSETKPRDPHIIRISSKSEIWFKQDDKFRVPKMSLDLEVSSCTAIFGPFDRILWHIFVELLTSSLNEEYLSFTGPAFLVWNISITDLGLRVKMYGYNDKLSVLMERVLSRIINYGKNMNDDVREKFITLKADYLRSALEKLSGDEADPTTSLMEHLLFEHSWPAKSLLQATHKLKFEDLKKFSTQVFQRVFLRGLIHGNCTNTEAKNIANIIEERFQSSNIMLQQELILQRRRVKIANGAHFIYQVTSEEKDDFGYSSFFQLLSISSEFQNVMSLLLTEIISGHCLPYVIDDDKEEPPVVECTLLTDMNGILGFLIKVQSKKRDPYYIDKKVERFIQSLTKIIVNITNKQLESFKKTVKMKQYKEPSELMTLSEAYWDEIRKRQYNFNRYEKELRLLHAFTVKEVQNCFQETFNRSFLQRRKLSIHIFPKDTEKNKQFIKNLSATSTLVEDPSSFKISSSLLAFDYRPQ